jgi:hypothetical protein
MIMSEHEQQIYLAPPTSSDSGSKTESLPTSSNASSFYQHSSKHQSSEDCESMYKRSEYLDHLLKINTMKFMNGVELKVASNVKFSLVDLRANKKPKLNEIFKKQSGIPILELDFTKRSKYSLKDFVQVLSYHIVLVTTEELENKKVPTKSDENERELLNLV